jgi:hypothetical protein
MHRQQSAGKKESAAALAAGVDNRYNKRIKGHRRKEKICFRSVCREQGE